jgi:hypothetical protein
MIKAAHAGKIDEVRRLVENGVSTNSADYDKRTGLVITDSILSCCVHLHLTWLDFSALGCFGGAPGHC